MDDMQGAGDVVGVPCVCVCVCVLVHAWLSSNQQQWRVRHSHLFTTHRFLAAHTITPQRHPSSLIPHPLPRHPLWTNERVQSIWPIIKGVVGSCLPTRSI